MNKRCIYYCLCVLCISFFACQPTTDKQDVITETDPKADSLKADASVFPSASELETLFPDWLSFYQKQFPALQFNQFILADSMDKDTFVVYPVRQPVQQAFQSFLKASSKDSIFLDVYSYGREWRKEKGVIADSPDSEVAIINTAALTRQRILFCGTQCVFEDGAWMDSNKAVAVVGLYQNDQLKWVPAIWYIVLKTKMIYIFPSSTAVDPKNASYLQQLLQ